MEELGVIRSCFLGLISYWIYLAFVSQPILVNDAKGYYELGLMIVQQGWPAYFTSGPNREPVYPFLVALSMAWSSPQTFFGVLKAFQVCLLGCTTLMVFLFLSRYGVSRSIALWAMVAIGISPAMVNTALSVYSEIAAHVLILGAAWWSSEVFGSLQKQKSKNFIWQGLGWAIFFLLAMLVKSVYEVIFYLCLIPFALLAWRSWRRQDNAVMKNTAVFLLTAMLVVQVGAGGYKYLNYQHNGLFVMTDRAAWACMAVRLDDNNL